MNILKLIDRIHFTEINVLIEPVNLYFISFFVGETIFCRGSHTNNLENGYVMWIFNYEYA